MVRRRLWRSIYGTACDRRLLVAWNNQLTDSTVRFLRNDKSVKFLQFHFFRQTCCHEAARTKCERAVDKAYSSENQDHSPTVQSLDNDLVGIAFKRLLHKIPDDILSTFDSKQLSAIALAIRPKPARHVIDYRVSLPGFRNRFYAVFLFGREMRSIERLEDEGQLRIGRVTATYGAVFFLLSVLLVLSASSFIYCINAMLAPEGGSHLNRTFVYR